MFCRFCGKEITNDSDFCRFCGKELSTIDERVNDLEDSESSDRKGLDALLSKKREEAISQIRTYKDSNEFREEERKTEEELHIETEQTLSEVEGGETKGITKATGLNRLKSLAKKEGADNVFNPDATGMFHTTAKVKDNRKKAIIGGVSAAVLIIITLALYITPKLEKSEMPNIIDLRGGEAKSQLMKTGITEDRVVFKELQNGKDLEKCPDYKDNVAGAVVFETNPANGEIFHTNTDTVTVGVVSIDSLINETKGGNPDKLLDLSEKYGVKTTAKDTYSNIVTHLVKQKPADWEIVSIAKYDIGNNRVEFFVKGR